MPPEYMKEGFISMKFDVFSLGVIILKIMAGNIGYPRCYNLPHEEFVELVSTKLLSCVSLSLSLSLAVCVCNLSA